MDPLGCPLGGDGTDPASFGRAFGKELLVFARAFPDLVVRISVLEAMEDEDGRFSGRLGHDRSPPLRG